jgi:transposase
MEVTEYQAEIKICRKCGREHKGTFPVDINNCVQYGERIKSIVIYLQGYQLLPFQRTAELCRELFSCPISEGTPDTILREGSNRLAIPVEQIKEQIKAAGVVNFDETGLSVNGKNHWLHSASTKNLTHYELHAKRGTEAMNEIGILPTFAGTAVHDGLPAYFQYDCQHSLCNAHHLRELTFIDEEFKQPWAGDMIDCLLEIKQTVEEAKSAFQKHLSSSQILDYLNRYQMILEKGYAANPLNDFSDANKTRGRPKKGKARCLVERLEVHRDQALAFMFDFEIPFDNNLAERDVRMAKVRQKISGTFRSREMAKAFCRIRSFISTARKRAFHTMDSIEKIFTDPSALSKIVTA